MSFTLIITNIICFFEVLHDVLSINHFGFYKFHSIMKATALTKVLFFVGLCFVLSIPLNSQILTPVKWKTSHKHVDGNTFDLVMTAHMDKGWAIYSQFTEEGGPVPTSFEFEEGSHYKKQGEVKEKGKIKEGMDKLFGVNVKKFPKGPVVFTQRVTVNDYSKPITGYLEFMTCDNARCLPPTEEAFSFSLNPVGKDENPKNNKLDRSQGQIEDKVKQTNTSTDKIIETVEKQVPAKPIIKTNAEKHSPTKKEVGKNATASNKEESSKEEISKTQLQKDAINKALSSGRFAEESTDSYLSPVDWEFSLHQIKGDLHELRIKALMDKNWTIYSQHSSDEGPVPTYFEFEEGNHFELVGEMDEVGKLKEGPDPLFDNVVVKKFVKDPVTFTQQLKIQDSSKKIKGFLEFMTCDNTRCLPPTPIYFAMNPGKTKIIVSPDEIGNSKTISIEEASANTKGMYNLAAVDIDNPIGICGEAPVEDQASKGLMSIFILGFFGGLLALLTPCVFPMIPLTVSFFTKGSDKPKGKGLRDAALYGSFIFLVYLLLSLPFHLLDSVNPDILNNISTNIYLNLFFFAIFVFFAFSFFGYYEIALPASLSNKVSAAEGVGGIVGIFFMALTLALVSFSCTGPILGSLLAGALSSDGGAMQLTSGMGGFGLALALPFAIFAAFPSLMSSLPKSGGWLTTTKVVLGFMELALAFKFLSNADLVKHWGLLKIEPYLIIWIIIGIATVLYLLGKIKFPHDSPIKKLSPVRLGLAAIFGAFTIYLMTGFQYDDKAQTFKPLKLLSGINPPVTYSWLYPKDCPANLDCFKDLEKGLTYAREVNKPVMIDFTGYACFNCRKMEENVWPKKEVFKNLKDEYVVISLYVDDRAELAEEDKKEVTKKSGGTRKLKTKGDKWQHFQTEYFNNNSQPYYVLMSPDGQLLNKPVGYTPDENDYNHFLQCGLEAFETVSGGSMMGETSDQRRQRSEF